MSEGNSKQTGGFLGKVAIIANKLPHPVTIFIIFSIVIAILTFKCELYLKTYFS